MGYRMEGNFSIQEAYHLARELPQIDLDPVWSKLWDRAQWPKIYLFLWLVVRGRILTWENLQKRGFTGPSQCIICRKDREDMAHLLDACPLASMLWDQGAQRFCRLDRVCGSPQATIRSWHPNPFQNPILNRLWLLFSGFLMWLVWKERNAQIFKGNHSTAEKTWELLSRNIRETILSISWTEEDFQASQREVRILNSWGILPDQVKFSPCKAPCPSSPDFWSPPPQGCLKINFDGAAKDNPGPTGYGGVVHDHLGTILWVFWGSIGWDTNNSAELEGAIHCLLLMQSLNLSPTIIEGDSWIIVTMAKKLQQGQSVDRITKNWHLEFRVERLAELLKQCPECTFSHIRRKGNKVADILANRGVIANSSYEIVKWHPTDKVDWMEQVSKAADQDRESPTAPLLAPPQ